MDSHSESSKARAEGSMSAPQSCEAVQPPESTISELDSMAPEDLRDLAERLGQEKRLDDQLTTLLELRRILERPEESIELMICAAAGGLDNQPYRLTVAAEALLHFPESYPLRCHYVDSSLKIGRDHEGLQVICEWLVNTDPQGVRGWQLRASVAVLDERWDEAIAARHVVCELCPDKPWAWIELIKTLLHADALDEAEQVVAAHERELREAGRFRELQTQITQRKELARLLIRPGGFWDEVEQFHSMTGFYYQRGDFFRMLKTFRNATQKDPENSWAQVQLIFALTMNSEFNEARALGNNLLTRFPQQRSKIIHHLSWVEEQVGNWSAAIEILVSECRNVSTGIWHVLSLCKIYCRMGRSADALELLDALPLATMSENNQCIASHIRALLLHASGQTAKAIRELSNLKTRVGAVDFEMRFSDAAQWYEVQRGNINAARRIFNESNERNAYRGLMTAEPPQELKAAESERPAVQQLLLFTIVRDERVRIHSFLQHYRKLGVEVFYIIDNGSIDGTREYLFEQPDVRLFCSSYSFTAASYGVWWVKYLMDRYAGERWCIAVDADELLVFPHSEHMTVKHLCQYMDQRGYDALPAFMLDMFPETLEKSQQMDPDSSLLEVCPYFDDSITFRPTYAAPYVCAGGGFRSRIMGDGSGPGIILGKVPLVKPANGVRYSHGFHNVSPCRVSDVSAALLHFKIAGNLSESLERHIESGQHFGNAAQYRRYKRWIDIVDVQDDLRGENTQRYESTSQLVDLGLIRSSSHFEDFVDTRRIPFNQSLPKLFILALPGLDCSRLMDELRLLGYGPAYVDAAPVHTAGGLLDTLCTHEVFAGESIALHYERLYHLLPRAHFIFLRSDAEAWKEQVSVYCLKTLGLLSPAEVHQLSIPGQPHQLSKRTWRIAVLKQLLGDSQCWEEVYNRYVDQLESVFEHLDRRRLLVVDEGSVNRAELSRFCATIRKPQ